MDDPKFRLAGRPFTPLGQGVTAAQDDYLMAHLRRSGALEVLTNQELPEEKRAEELLTAIMLSGESFHILAGCLTEVGKKWSRADADRNAAAFADISDREEKTAMRGAIVGFVIGFFGSARRSSATSQKSSSRTDEGQSTSTADPATSETSIPSSEPSPAEIPAVSTR